MPTVIVKGIKGGHGVKPGANLRKKLVDLANLKVSGKVGFLSKATYSDGTSVAYVAYLNEYGGHNPPRPFLKETETKHAKKWAKGIKTNLMQTGITQASMLKAYTMAAQVAVGDVKRTIADWPEDKPRPNAESTIAAKARRGRSGRNLAAINPNRVLIDTGRMIGAIDYEVKKIERS